MDVNVQRCPYVSTRLFDPMDQICLAGLGQADDGSRMYSIEQHQYLVHRCSKVSPCHICLVSLRHRDSIVTDLPSFESYVIS